MISKLLIPPPIGRNVPTWIRYSVPAVSPQSFNSVSSMPSAPPSPCATHVALQSSPKWIWMTVSSPVPYVSSCQLPEAGTVQVKNTSSSGAPGVAFSHGVPPLSNSDVVNPVGAATRVVDSKHGVPARQRARIGAGRGLDCTATPLNLLGTDDPDARFGWNTQSIVAARDVSDAEVVRARGDRRRSDEDPSVHEHEFLGQVDGRADVTGHETDQLTA